MVARQVHTSIVNNVKLALLGKVGVPDTLDLPCWIDCESPWDAKEILPAPNALFRISSLARGVDDHLEPTPRFFSTFALDYSIRLDAPTPSRWLEFMNQLWGEDPESIATLQEFMGYFLTQDTSYQKILMLSGPPRSGKGTIEKVIAGTVGERNICASSFSSLKSNFGLQTFLGKSLAILPDAHSSKHDDTVVQRLKSISGGDLITIDRKFATPISVRLSTRLLIDCNQLPRFKDTSGALANRMIILRLTKSFLDREDTALAERLLAERSGILLWAIAGWKRLTERGRFVQPESGLPLRRDLENISSPVGQFVRECCRTDSPHAVVPRQTLYQTYVQLYKSTGHDFAPLADNTFGSELRAVVPSLGVSHPVIDGKQVWCYTGIALVRPAAPNV
jgi:putative DNA primase/helicase